MSTMRAVTLRLDAEDYERLEAEASRLGVPPATLGRVYVRAGLNGEEPQGERRRRAGLDALDRLAALTAGLPAVDAVQISHESRDELESRPRV